MSGHNSGYGGPKENPPFSGRAPTQDGSDRELNRLFPLLVLDEGIRGQVGHNAPNSTDRPGLPLANNMPNLDGGSPAPDGSDRELNRLVPRLRRAVLDERIRGQVGHNAPNSTDRPGPPLANNWPHNIAELIFDEATVPGDPLFASTVPNIDDLRWQHVASSRGMPWEKPESESDSDLFDPQSPRIDAHRDEPPGADNRLYVPENQWEEWTILNALQFTREDHQERLNSPTTIPTNEQACYLDQYKEMQKTFERRWRRRHEGPAPTLVCLDPWTGDLDNWTPKDPDWKIRMFPTDSEKEEFEKEARSKGKN